MDHQVKRAREWNLYFTSQKNKMQKKRNLRFEAGPSSQGKDKEKKTLERKWSRKKKKQQG